MNWRYIKAKYSNDLENIIYVTECYFKNTGEVIGWVDPIDLFSKGLYGSDMEDLKTLIENIKQCISESNEVLIIDKENNSCWIENLL